VNAGSGDDVIDAHDDPGIDTIDCGDGIDTVHVFGYERIQGGFEWSWSLRRPRQEERCP
jgi:hypothetical protein